MLTESFLNSVLNIGKVLKVQVEAENDDRCVKEVNEHGGFGIQDLDADRDLADGHAEDGPSGGRMCVSESGRKGGDDFHFEHDQHEQVEQELIKIFQITSQKIVKFGTSKNSKKARENIFFRKLDNFQNDNFETFQIKFAKVQRTQ